MKTMKKMLLLAGMALASMAFAVPAVASAAEWTKEGEPLVEPQTVQLHGPMGSSLGFGQWYCSMDAEAELHPSGEASIVRFEVETETCTGSGAYQGCEAEEALVNELPWAIGISQGASTKFIVSDFGFRVNWVENTCPAMGMAKEVQGEMVMTPDNAKAITKLSVQVDDALVFGHLNVTPAGVYGVTGS